MRLVYFVNLLFAACMGLEQHAAFDFAAASSTRSAGNLVGSPAFNVSRRLVVAGFDFLIATFSHWHVICPRCSNGNHAMRQSRNAPISSHHCLIADSWFVANIMLSCSAILSMLAGCWWCWWCILCMRPCRRANFAVLRHHVSISAQLF